jgi:hypothetical protein
MSESNISVVDSDLKVGRNMRFEQGTFLIQSTTFYPAALNYIKDTCVCGGGGGSSNKNEWMLSFRLEIN